MRSLRSLATAVLILLLTRVIGVLRDILISVTYGLTRLTDLFFQSTFFPTYILNIYNGPFTTAFVASLNHEPEARRSLYLLRYRRSAILTGTGLSALYFAGSILAAYLNGRISPHDVLVTCAILTPSCLAMAILGYGVAVANACGMISRAIALLTVSNVVFVLGVVLIWLNGRPGETWFLQLAFTVSSSIAAAIAWVSIDQILSKMPGPPLPRGILPKGAPAGLPGFQRGLWLALAESSAFIATQLIVLAMASHEGVGWASAATLAQRLCLSAISLVIMPVSSTATVAVINNRTSPHRLFGAIVLAVFVVTSLGAAVLAAIGPWAAAWAAAHGKINAEASNLLGQLIPAFAVWLVAMSLNGMVSRLLFGLKLGRIYVTTTIVAYVVANVVRVIATLSHNFPAAIALGAAIELVAVVSLAAYVFIVLRARAGDHEAGAVKT